MVPRSRGGKVTETLCADCHRAIHARWTNKELEKKYHTVEALMADPDFARQVGFLGKQDPTRRFKTLQTKNRRRRGRYS
jgi:hypothetical protein